ncbi:MAG: DUF4390 domain-containing protein [Desulfococcaceae bacterium]|jgi:hypothetical protein|nr:DUF4390 domain-containing protein [Desulfococcaceae bacterium]
MKSFISRKKHLFFFCVFLYASECAALTGARLADMFITNSQGNLLVYLKVKNAFSRQIQQTVFSGVPTTFSFFIRVEQKRSLWTDKELAEAVLTHTIKYDNLKKEFSIRRSWEKGRNRIVRSPEEAERLMSDVEGYPILPMDKLEKGADYEIQAMAKLSKISLPFYLRYLPVTPSIARFETEWYTIAFEY